MNQGGGADPLDAYDLRVAGECDFAECRAEPADPYDVMMSHVSGE